VNHKGGDDEYGGGLRISADQLYNIDSARSRYAKRMELHCNGLSNAIRLRELLAPYRNNLSPVNAGRSKGGNDWSCPVLVVYRNQSAVCELELGDAWRVSLQDNLLQSLSAHFKAENVRVIY
jgi:DNA polymerase III subunit alpha